MEVTLIFGIELLSGDGLHRCGNQHTNHPAAVQGRNGQQIHHRQIDGNEGAEIQHIQQGVQHGGRSLCYCGHLLDNANRTGHVSQARLTGEEHLQTQPYQPDCIQTLPPGIVQFAEERKFLNGEIHTKQHLGGSVFPGNGMLFHVQVGKFNFPAFPLHHKIVVFTGIQSQNQRKIRLNMDLFTVQFQNPVADTQAIFSIHRAEGFKRINHRLHHCLGGQVDDDHQNDTHDKIHGRTGHQNHQALPPGGFLKRTGIVGILILAFHGAVTADGNQTDGIQGFPNLLLPQGRTHEHGKFVNLDTGKLRRCKVAEFVNKNKNAEQKDCKKNAHRLPRLEKWGFILPYAAQLPGPGGRSPESLPEWDWQ